MSKLPTKPAIHPNGYQQLFTGISSLLETARRNTVRSVNSIMTATYWEIGRQIVEFENEGKARSDDGTETMNFQTASEYLS